MWDANRKKHLARKQREDLMRQELQQQQQAFAAANGGEAYPQAMMQHQLQALHHELARLPLARALVDDLEEAEVVGGGFVYQLEDDGGKRESLSWVERDSTGRMIGWAAPA